MITRIQVAPDETLLTLSEAMAYLRVSRTTLYRLMWSGQLTGHKIGHGWRFYPSDLRAQIVRQQQEVETVTTWQEHDNEQEWKASEHEPLSAHLEEWIQPFVLERLEEHAQEQKVSVGVALNTILRQSFIPPRLERAGHPERNVVMSHYDD